MFSLENKFSYKIFYPIFFISGVCSLAYELIWIKMFIPIFGIGLYSVSAVVSSFMGGLALGSYICGKVIDYKKNLLKYYAFFEFLIGTYSLILPLLINTNRTTMPFFYNNISSNFYIFSIFRFMFAFVLLIIPCSLMGATLPVMSRVLIISSRGNVEKDFSILYALNTFGAVCGCLIVTFFMLEHFGIAVSSYMFAVINMLIGIFVYLYGLNHKFDYLNSPEKFLNTRRNEVLSNISSCPRNVLFVAFLCGFCALSFEILLVRVLATLLPNDVYLFSIVLITILIAISFGSFLNSAWITKFKNYSFVLGISMVISGFILAVTLRYLPFQLGKLGYFNWHICWYIAIVCLGMIFPAGFFMGIIFPNLVALYSAGIKSVGHDVGSVYSMNTFGAVLGSFLTGFIFIPFLGLRNTFFSCLAVYILAGEFVFIATFKKIKSIPILIFTITLSSIFLLKQLIPVNLFRDIFVENISDGGKLVFYKEGIVCSMGVFKHKVGFGLRYSDRTAVGAEVSQTGLARSNHRLKAHIPMILHKDPHTVINIGFGTGISAYSLTLHNIDRVDNVEICAQTLEVTKFFIDNLSNLFNNSKTNLIIDDGRNFLFVTKRKYDIIFVYPFHPLLAENIYFYTKDFLQLCKSKLNPDGLISIWFPTRVRERSESLILLKTFLEVFPNSALFSTYPASSYDDVGLGGLLVGSVAEDGLNLSPAYLEKRLHSLNSVVKTELIQSNINNAQDLLKRCVVSGNSLTKLCNSVKEIVTDNRTILDYRAARTKWIKKIWSRQNFNVSFERFF